MKNKYLIETIYRMMEEDASFTEFNANEIFLAFMNGYYYIKPNEDTMKFAFAIDDVIAEGHVAGKHIFELRDENVSLDACNISMTALATMNHIRKSFDEEYFKSQIDHFDYDEENNETLLETYLKKFNKAQLKEFLSLVIDFRKCQLELINSSSFELMFDDFDAESRKIDNTIPSFGTNEFVKFFQNNMLYFIDYLDESIITEIICKYMNERLITTGLFAKALYYTNKDVACYYLAAIDRLETVFGPDVFKIPKCAITREDLVAIARKYST